jgi:hypothetical protein
LLIAYHFGARWQQQLSLRLAFVTAAGNNAYTCIGVVSSEFFEIQLVMSFWKLILDSHKWIWLAVLSSAIHASYVRYFQNGYR